MNSVGRLVFLSMVAWLALPPSANPQPRVLDPMAETIGRWFTMIEESFVAPASQPAGR